MTDKVLYINSQDSNALEDFINELSLLLKEAENSAPIIFLCIGTDRITGDSLGPLVGHMLKNTIKHRIYGTLEQPVHAKNLEQTIKEIYKTHKNPFVVAIDASLGDIEHIGYLTIGKGPVKPGAGIHKLLPQVGDIFVTGIVNYYCIYDKLVLQNTRLHLVMKMADVVSAGIKKVMA